MPKKSKKIVDPVCKMDVDEKEYCSEFKGKEYCFCSEECMEDFKKDPERFTKK